MSTKTKVWILIGASLIVAGCLLFGGVMVALNWDFVKLGTSRFETRVYTVEETFGDITVVTDTADITFLPSESGKCEVHCYETEKVSHTVTVTDGTLTVQAEDTRKWYDYIQIDFTSPKITVYLPQTVYEVLTVKSSTGNVAFTQESTFDKVDITAGTGHIRLQNMTAQSLSLGVSTGGITLNTITCQNGITIHGGTGNVSVTNIRCTALTADNSTGDIWLHNVIAADALSLTLSTGDATLNGCDAATITIKTSTGDVKGRLLSGKTYTVSTRTGDVSVPDNTAGGTCRVTTGTGDITITEVKS